MAVDWTTASNVITAAVGIPTAIVGVGTFAISTWQSIRSNRLDRYNNFEDVRARFAADAKLRLVIVSARKIGRERDERKIKEKNESNQALSQIDESSIENIDENIKYSFMSFYEEIALMVQSELLQESLAFYMFSYELLIVCSNPKFYSEDIKQDSYWSLFNKFYERMKKYEGDHSGQVWPVAKFKF